MASLENHNIETPLVSIITPVRNMEKTVERTIQSVLGQTYKNIEYIVIDGGSTDQTLDIIKRYQDGIKYWISEPDKGISDAFNKGIRSCQGEIIGIINADDWFELNALEGVIAEHRKSLDERCIFFGKTKYYQDDAPLFIYLPSLNLENICFEMSYSHPACFVSKKCYEEFGLFDETFFLAMDYELLLRFHLKGVRFRFVDEVLANMSFDGRSDRNEMKALLEVRKARIKNKCKKYAFRFWVHFISKWFKRRVRLALGRENKILQIYRRLHKNKVIIK